MIRALHTWLILNTYIEELNKMAEGSQHGGHPIVKSIEEKLRAAITVEHFVCHPAPSSLLRDKGIWGQADKAGDSGYIR